MNKIGIVSLVGKYRTGKSFLLNRVLLNEKRDSGFDVGPTIKPCTKGIWMWSKPVLVENNHSKDKFSVFFIDTEGLGAYDEEINHDSKIFLIAVLISSLFLFNSFGNIDESSINSLSFILNLSKTIKINQNENTANPEEIAKYFPSLFWLLRDFSLKLEDSEGNTITAKQYLENALNLQKGSSEIVEEKNKVRKMIKTFFPERDCFSMVRPVEDEKDLQNLQTLDNNRIRPEFLEQAEILRNKVFKKVKPKSFNGKILSGSMLVELIKSILESINSGGIPVIENSWKYVLHNESQKNITDSVNNYKAKINKFKDDNKENTNFFSDLDNFQKKLIKDISNDFEANSPSLDKSEIIEFTDKLKTKINEEYKRFNDENAKFFENRMSDILDKNTKKLVDAFETDKYAKNYYQFFQDLENLKEITESCTPDFPMKKEIIFEKMITIVKKFIEMTFLKNKILNEKEITNLRNDLANITNKLKIKTEEYENLKNEGSVNNDKLNKQFHELKSKEKSLEDRIKILENEKRVLEGDLEKKVREIKNENENRLEKLKNDINKLENELKNKDDQILKMKFNDEKMNALANQKAEFIEREVSSLKERNDHLKRENTDYKATIDDLCVRNDDLKNQLVNSKLDRDRDNSSNNINVFKGVNLSFDNPNNQTNNTHNKIASESFTGNNEIVNLLKSQLDATRSQLEDNKKMYDEIINTFKINLSNKPTEENEQRYKEVLESNKVKNNF